MRSWFTALALHAVALSCVAVRAVPSPTPPTPPTPSSLRGVSFGEDVGEVGLKEVMFIETGAGAKLYGHRVLSSHHAGSAKCHKLAKKDDACRNDGRPSGVVKDGSPRATARARGGAIRGIGVRSLIIARTARTTSSATTSTESPSGLSSPRTASAGASLAGWAKPVRTRRRAPAARKGANAKTGARGSASSRTGARDASARPTKAERRSFRAIGARRRTPPL